MKKIVKISLWVLSTAAVLFIGWCAFVFYMVSQLDFDPYFNHRTVEFKELDRKVYMTAMAWGLTGDHTRIVVSPDTLYNEVDAPDSTRSYIFKGRDMLYYKRQGPDTLFLYMSLVAERPPLPSFDPIKVIIVDIYQYPYWYDDTTNYEKNYRSYGWSRFGLY